MTERENQKRLDRLAMTYLSAVDAGDFDAIDALWAEAAGDAALADMLHRLNAHLAAEQDAGQQTAVADQVVAAIAAHMPSAEVILPASRQLTVADVAEHLRRNPPRGLTADDLRINDELKKSEDPLPADLGVARVVAWGRRFGNAPEPYWRAFRAAALKLLMRQESAENYQMAARPAKPKPPEGTP
jgi:hypothetical protein